MSYVVSAMPSKPVKIIVPPDELSISCSALSVLLPRCCLADPEEGHATRHDARVYKVDDH